MSGSDVRIPLPGGPGVDLNDLRQQIEEIQRSGLTLTRGGLADFDYHRTSQRILGIMDSMTPLERFYPFLISVPTRCSRIARGAGVQPSEVSEFFASLRSFMGSVNRLDAGW
jgi:signal recognition particle GTPase